ncbi:MAG TPA: hypothetical protein VD908_07615 [Cytophagales bacterium]|nr:hypothetical protein [Cytophagales bacterium]
MALSIIVACKEDDQELKLNPAPTAGFTLAPSSANPNYIIVTNTSTGSDLLYWDFGNGANSSTSVDTAYYPYPGDYAITLTAYSNGGKSVSTQTVSVTTTDPDLCNNEVYTLLTGGCAVEGKTWVFDPVNPMNFGGSKGGPTMEWWGQTLAQQEPCMKDDEYVFSLEESKFTANTGDAMWGILDKVENQCVPQANASASGKWSLNITADKTTLTLSDKLTMAWDDDEGVYEIVELTEDKLWIRKECCGGGGLRNYVFVPKGSAPNPNPEPEPEPEPEGKALESHDISADFEAAGTMTWDAAELEAFDGAFANPESDAVNGSAKVAKYVKGTDGPTGSGTDNLRFDLDYRIDLSTRNKFKLKIYAPSTNDYTTENTPESWQTYKTLQKLVSVKLQDSKSAEPWNGQAEVKHEITALDEWIELEFDFSGSAAQTKYDRILIQIGGEGNHNAGTFYFDDLVLLP